MDFIQNNYVEELTPETLIEKALKGNGGGT